MATTEQVAVATPRPQRVRTLRAARTALVAIGFAGPALVFYTFFLIVPLLGTIALSFTDWTGLDFGQINWVGLQNYREIVHDHIFWMSIEHNLAFLVGTIVLKTAIALFLAVALHQRLPLSNLFRGIYFLPAVLSLVVVGIVFSLVLSPSLGLINPLLRDVGLGGFAGDWLGDPDRVLPILILIDTWGGFGLYMFLFVARLMTIPEDLTEAASVDGAGTLRTLVHVTLPLLRSTIAMVVLLAAIHSLRLFEIVYVMTSGGPVHQSEVLSTWAYFQAFTANRVGYGSAILVALLAITFVLSYIHVTRFQPKEQV